jgi:hypothetical protein
MRIPKELIFGVAVSITLAIITHNFLFVIPILVPPFLLLRSRLGFIIKGLRLPRSLDIGEGLIRSQGLFKSVLVIDDIEYDFRDFTEGILRSKISAFYKILNIKNNIRIFVNKRPVEKEDYMKDLFQRAQNLRIQLEADPSNERLKAQLDLVESIIKRINDGETPFKYYMAIVVDGSDERACREMAEVVKRGMESIGVKARFAKRSEIVELISDFFRGGGTGGNPAISSQLVYISPFSIPRSPRREISGRGIYLGVSQGGSPVFWNLVDSLNPHTLVIGPSGSGKTEFLISLGVKLWVLTQMPVVIFDVKGDFRSRLRERGVPFHLIRPDIEGLSLLTPYYCSLEDRLQQVERILAVSFRLPPAMSAVLYKALRETFESRTVMGKLEYRVKWEDVIENLSRLEVPYAERLYLERVINVMASVEGEESVVDRIKQPGLYIVDLTSLRSEEIRRAIIYSLMLDVYNRYSVAVRDRPVISVVIDEAWTILAAESDNYSIVTDLIKRGRGFGLAIFMASQNIHDLGSRGDVILENVGLLALMNNGDREFWERAKRFAIISDQEIEEDLLFSSRGEALVRFLGDPRPAKVKLDVFVPA